VLLRVRVYYDASREYGRSTTPDSGLFYLGSAQAERDFAAFARRLLGVHTGHAALPFNAEIAEARRE
jgi:hypothetical protein